MTAAQPDLFGAPSEAPARARTGMDPHLHAHAPTRGMARIGDPETSREAAAAQLPKLTAKQVTVLTAFAAFSTLTGKQLERLPACAAWAPSTARKRITELAGREGGFRLIATGRVVDGCAEFRETTPYERALLLEGKTL